MNIAPIKYDNSRRYKSANPSFQNLKIMTPEHWDKDILDLVKHNAEIKKLEKVIIFTDGACSGNPGPGGWGAIIIKNGKEKEISGRKRNTTNK